MRLTLPFAALLVALTAPAPALADQCAWNTSRHVAKTGARTIASTHHLQHFCAPCGDVEGTVEQVQSATTRVERSSGRRYHVVVVNGEDVDLAYVYVPDGPDAWRNVGLTAGCGARDVPAILPSPSRPQPPSPSTSASENGTSG